MENEKESTMSIFLNESSLGALKRYLPYVIIMVLSATVYVLWKDGNEKSERILKNAEEQAAAWQQSNEKSMELLLKMSEEKNRNKRRNNESDDDK